MTVLLIIAAFAFYSVFIFPPTDDLRKWSLRAITLLLALAFSVLAFGNYKDYL